MGKKIRDTIQKANDWAEGLWSGAINRWKLRTGQDRRYRLNVVHPLCRSILMDRFPDGNANLIDLGCGDGILASDEGLLEMVRNGRYLGIDRLDALLSEAEGHASGSNVSFLHADLADRALTGKIPFQATRWNAAVSVMAMQEIPDIETFASNLTSLLNPGAIILLISVHPSFGNWLRESGAITPARAFDADGLPWRWAGAYPIVDEPKPPFYLPYFHRDVQDMESIFEKNGLHCLDIMQLPDPSQDLPRLVESGTSPFRDYPTNVYWPGIAEQPSSIAFVLEKKAEHLKPGSDISRSTNTSKGGEYDALRDYFVGLFPEDEDVSIERYESPDLYSPDRVTYIIPPITMHEDRENWKPANLYVVREGVVSIGRVFYTKTSGEYLVEELILRRGDIFGEFEVPISILGYDIGPLSVLPPRFNMTYGAWASGSALNWAMAYPRYIPRDAVAPENAKTAVHPFYIKSKNIRPDTGAVVVGVPVAKFEEVVAEYPDAMRWFLMNVLKKTRLYFEPPSPGYGRSPERIISRLIIRILAHRIRLGTIVAENRAGVRTCRTFIGPTEWIKYGLGPYMGDFKSLILESGGKPKTTHILPLFNDELSEIIEVVYHFPVKDLDDAVLTAMGCSPEEDRRENRYGLLTGLRIECRDLDYFMKYLLEHGE